MSTTKKPCIIFLVISEIKILARVGAIIFVAIAFFVIFRSLYNSISSFTPDFSVLWLGAKDLLSRKNPYLDTQLFTGIGYPPNTLLFYFPLTVFSYELAQTIFAVLSLFSIIMCVYLSFRIFRERVPTLGFFIALSLVFFSFPTRFTIGMGQNNAIVLLLLLASYYLYKNKGNKIIVGLLLGCSFALKTIFAFFFLFLFIKREWKVIFYSLLPLIVGVILVSAVSNSGIDIYSYYFKEVIPPLFNLSGRGIYYNQGLSGFAARLNSDLVLQKYLIGGLSITILVSLLIISLKSKSSPFIFSLFIISLVLIDTLSWQHHFVWLIFPFIALTCYFMEHKELWKLVLLFLSYILVSWNFKEPDLYSKFPLGLLLSNTFYGAVILFLLNYRVLLKELKKD